MRKECNSVNMTSELTIVIPAKNEAKLLPRLLTSLSRQDYCKMPITKLYLADAGSADGTPDIARGFADRLDIEVISGGLPATGRNNGARLALTPYVLFIDADIELADGTLIRRAVEKMRRNHLHCLTTNISCPLGSPLDRFLYGANNMMQRLSRLTRPFSTGMFMLLDRARFQELGGFHEGALFAEDYMLSKQVARNKFGIVRGSVMTTNRRFRKMGHFRIVRLFVRTALNTWNDSFFLRDHKYWHSEA
jgi:glycosyltransferase involved in cell wall biosynthesis